MKTLHMIGFSHIDPVWFWDRTEGEQEARATFRSALERMEEFPDFRFTCTSPALLDFIRRLDPELFEGIRKRVAEGRMEVTGGFWVEPDCNLPCGESMVRQGLYGQAFLQEAFGQRARVGGNVDSFGHGPGLPQVLRGCGMDSYYFMRPRLTAINAPQPAPLFTWRGTDGSAVLALCLPGEYTVWFEETLRENIQASLGALAPYPSLPCFFGVGNHGGGPTIANIRAVMALRAEFPAVHLPFSTLGAFFDENRAAPAPPVDAYLEGVNTGCYSIDHPYKQGMRRAEQALLRAERLNAMARLAGAKGTEGAQAFAPLWKRLLFCQFHDTLGGTSIRAARDNALRDLDGVTAQAERLIQEAVTRISRQMDTRGEGSPILLFNDSAQPFSGLIDLELNWFCKDPLTITDVTGRELATQLAKNACTMRWYRLGGRRRVLFETDIPAFGCALVRAHAREPQSPPADGIPHKKALRLENEHLLAEFDGDGRLVRLMDRHTGYEALGAPMAFDIWHDQRDSWGHGREGRLYEPSDESFVTREARLVEQGPLRSAVRVRLASESCRLELVYTLDCGARALQLSIRALWDGPWKSLKLRLQAPGAYVRSQAEAGYALMDREPSDTEVFMHRHVDAREATGAGLAVLNDSVYSFALRRDSLVLTLLRSAIFAHGDCIGWQNDLDTYEYTDLGEHAYRFLLVPHGLPLEEGLLSSLADALHAPPLHFADTAHPPQGGNPGPASLMALSPPGVRLCALKAAEDGEGLILRLWSTLDREATASLRLGGQTADIPIQPQQALTLRAGREGVERTDMLEETR